MCMQSVNREKIAINSTPSEISEETKGLAIDVRNFYSPMFTSIRRTLF